jgi:hypothetical protein
VNCRRLFSRAALVAAAFVFAGCSGSSETPELVLSAQNAEAAAAQAVGAVGMLEGMSEMAEGFSEGTLAEEALPCVTGSGNSTVNDVAPVGEISTGDSASITFNNCVLDLGGFALELNGTFSFTATDVTAADPAFDATVAVMFRNFSMSVEGVTVSMNGGFTHHLSTTDGVAFTSVVTGTTFSTYAQGEAGQTFTGTISDFRLERQYDVGTGAYLWDLDATVTGTGIGGWVTYDTTSPFTGTDPDYPDAGTLVVSGANNGTATVIAIDNVDVDIELDADGDGTPEATISTTWDVLDS